MNLLTVQNAKTVKGEKLGYLTGILYMTPAFSAVDGLNLCPQSTAGCRAGCLNTAGRGIFNSVQAGRARKRALFLKDRKAFIARLNKEIGNLHARAVKKGMRPVVRLNGTTDINWYGIAPDLFHGNPRVRFYDYTKNPARVLDSRPKNYDLTFSRSEGRDAIAQDLLVQGARVAVVFDTPRNGKLPSLYLGTRVVDGDRHDLRFLDRKGVVIGLRAKGKARRDQSGFVVVAKPVSK
jgi:hypothetical protein